MSEKVILTQEQYRVIKKALENRSGDKARLLEDHAKMRGCWIAEYEVMDDLTISDMARVIYDSEFEVEKPKFKMGDKVTLDGLGEVLEIINIYDVSGTPFCNFENMAGSCSLANVRHATPEEIYWLHELGRDKVNDFQLGDLCVFEGGTLYTIVDQYTGMIKNDDWCTADQAIEWSGNGNFKGIYPAESFKPFKKEQTNEPK